MTGTSVGRLSAVLALVAMVGLAGCDVNKTTGQRTLTGAGVGAAGGAAVGLLTGNFLGSTLTGAAAGAAGGFVYDQIKKNQ